MISKILVAKQKIKLLKLRHLLATGFGSGMFPYMPGTLGSLIAIPLWYLLMFLPWQLYSIIIILSIYLGIHLCNEIEKDLCVHDHNCIVWDEFIGMWITLVLFPINHWKSVLVGFLLFRLLDIYKPWPICWFHLNINGGIGVIIDDVIAGIISAIILFCIGHYLILF